MCDFSLALADLCTMCLLEVGKKKADEDIEGVYRCDQ